MDKIDEKREALKELLGEGSEVRVYSREGTPWNGVFVADIMTTADEYALEVLEEMQQTWAAPNRTYLNDDTHVCPYVLEDAAAAIRDRLKGEGE